VRRRPYSVILFDEIEKAHPDVFNVLLQILDDGRVTDSHGHTVNFKNTIIIMTSNIGSQHIVENAGGDYETIKKTVMAEMKNYFRPEFLNRVDEIVVFHGLSRDQLKQIVEIQLGRLRERLAERKIVLELTERARDHFANVGYDPVYGARPLKRLLQKEIETSLARQILAGTVTEGSQVVVDVGPDGQLVFRSEPLSSAA